MTGLTALDVVIGLVFIYSLLAFLMQEIIATNLSFRARVLVKGINPTTTIDGLNTSLRAFLAGVIPTDQLLHPIILTMTGYAIVRISWPATGILCQNYLGVEFFPINLFTR